MNKSLTFIIPCYNESSRLLQTEECFVNFYSKAESFGNILFIDDGSSDNTYEKLQEICTRLSDKFKKVTIDCIRYEKNVGKGWALKHGIDKCKTDWCLTIDADMAAKPDELLTWFNNNLIHKNNNTVYFGSREQGLDEGRVTTSWIRKTIGETFNLIIKIITGIKFRDTQCGFKMYPTSIAKSAFENLADYGFAHDVEVIIKLLNNGIQIDMLPITWNEIAGSKVNIITDSFKMLLVVIKLRFTYGKLKT